MPRRAAVKDVAVGSLSHHQRVASIRECAVCQLPASLRQQLWQRKEQVTIGHALAALKKQGYPITLFQYQRHTTRQHESTSRKYWTRGLGAKPCPVCALPETMRAQIWERPKSVMLASVLQWCAARGHPITPDDYRMHYAGRHESTPRR